MTRWGKSHAGKKEFTVKCGEKLGGENMCGEEVSGERPPHRIFSCVRPFCERAVSDLDP
jgi:hypothetical protein